MRCVAGLAIAECVGVYRALGSWERVVAWGLVQVRVEVPRVVAQERRRRDPTTAQFPLCSWRRCNHNQDGWAAEERLARLPRDCVRGLPTYITLLALACTHFQGTFPNKVLSFVMLNYALQNVNLSSKPARPRQGHVHRNRPLYFVYLLFEMTLVIACRMVIPAFSVSFFVRPLVTQTLRAGVGCHPASRGLTPRPSGKALSLVIKTPFARHCHCSLATLSPIRRSRSIIPHRQHRAGSGSGLRY
jgi:hypothetical protein